MGEVTLKGFQCERCGHVWVPREDIPRVCPKCKSPYWDKPRKVEGKKQGLDFQTKRRLR